MEESCSFSNEDIRLFTYINIGVFICYARTFVFLKYKKDFIQYSKIEHFDPEIFSNYLLTIIDKNNIFYNNIKKLFRGSIHGFYLDFNKDVNEYDDDKEIFLSAINLETDLNQKNHYLEIFEYIYR